MEIILFHYFIFIFLTLTNGLIISWVLNLELEKKNFLIVGIFGIILTGLIANIFTIFIPLNDNLILINILISLIYLFYQRKILSSKLKKIKINYLHLSLLLIIFFQILGSGFSDDLLHYHASYITNTDNTKSIFGLNFLHNHFGYSSMWLTLHSYFNFNNYFLQDIHILNSIIFTYLLFYLLNEVLNGNKELKFISLFLLFFFLAKYTRLKEFGVDRPAILISIFLILEYLKILKSKKFYYSELFLIFSSTIFLISIKLIYIFTLLMPIHLFFFKLNNKFLFFKTKYLISLSIFVLIYFSKNLIVTGCLVYPIEKTCPNQIEWSSKDIAKKIYLNTAASSKSYDQYKGNLKKENYIKNFNWIKTWLKRNGNELKDFVLTIFFIFVISLFVFKEKKIKKKRGSIVSLILFFNLIIFLITPVIRYHHFLFLLLIIFFNNYLSINKINLKKFYLLFIILTTFNLTKNITRNIENNFFESSYKPIQVKEWYQPAKLKFLGSFNYYIGWHGYYPIGNEDLSFKKYKYNKFFGYSFILKK